VLNVGQGRVLTEVLAAGRRQLSQGNFVAACGQLTAFANQVKAFVAGGILSPAQGQALLSTISGVCQ
jgi:hypothetical protein